MLQFLKDNLATILVSAAVLTVVVFVIVKLVRDKRKGKSTCGCGCENWWRHSKMRMRES